MMHHMVTRHGYWLKIGNFVTCESGICIRRLVGARAREVSGTSGFAHPGRIEGQESTLKAPGLFLEGVLQLASLWMEELGLLRVAAIGRLDTERIWPCVPEPSRHDRGSTSKAASEPSETRADDDDEEEEEEEEEKEEPQQLGWRNCRRP
ncbi:hypothetical protein N7539_003666 [Penicillium diatomitis]|uniref:Uncharacterized protein n=1 Tax=Penicillium diatomitis TaxID=2819901 RepID=A0A9W9XCQ8_9EURO|nr:uncharacterized protein N7539_003666 [Penicillium diatomitis]KAJ5488776.1 hypothetical protein N7539_003666 [Penicillium diatomitis]